MSVLLRDRHYNERIAAAKAKVKIALETGTTEPHPNDARAWRGGGDRRYRIPTIGLNAGALPGSNPEREAQNLAV